MSRTRSTLFAGVVGLAAALVGTPDAPAAGPPATQLFEDARFAPEDVTGYVHLQDGAAVRRLLAPRPAGRLLNEALGLVSLRRAWQDVARRAAMTSSALFDDLLGGRVSLLTRRDATGRTDWVLIAQVDPADQARIVEGLRLERLGPQRGFQRRRLPEHEIVVAFSGARCVFAPAANPGLFDDVLARAGGAEGLSSLAGRPFMTEVADLPGGEIGIYFRNTGLMGGWSVLVADVEDGRIEIAHAGRFEQAPFTARPTRKVWDCAALDGFRDRSVVAMAEPMDVGPSWITAYLEQMLDESMVSAPMRRRLGEHRILVLGEAEGRGEPNRVDLLLPTFAVAFEVDDAAAGPELDRQLRRLASAWNQRTGGAFDLEFPPIDDLRPGAPRHMDLRPVADRFGAKGFPVMRSLRLAWTVVGGPGGHYGIIATHEHQLQETVRALRDRLAQEQPPHRRGRWTSVGTANGVQLNRMLTSWRDQTAMLAAPGTEESFRETLDVIALLSAGVAQACWELERPCEHSMQLRVHVDLAAPESDAAANRE